MVINSSQVLISELEFRSHSGDLAPLLYYYKQKPCTLQGRKIDNSLTNICRWCTEMCVFWPKAAALPCFPAEHSANAVIHSPYELLVPLIPLKNCFHTSIAARLILPENILLSEDYSTLLFQRILWSLPPIHPENPESPPPHIHGYQIIFLWPSRSLVPWNVTYWVTFWPQKPSLLKGKKENSDFYTPNKTFKYSIVSLLIGATCSSSSWSFILNPPIFKISRYWKFLVRLHQPA